MSYSVRESKDSVRCTLCPHRCAIRRGKKGICRVRHNIDGDLALPFYGVLSSIAVDPIEKKPLYHYYPGNPILSVGMFGCNFQCPFCQNHTISQQTETNRDSISPARLVELAEKQSSFGIAYTYSEPLIHFEYLLDACNAAHAAGIKNVLVTNGYINGEPAHELLPYVDAANIDLKAYTDGFYKAEIKGSLAPVLEFIRTAYDIGVHIEITTLVIPDRNDTDDEIRAISDFIAGIDSAIPYHLSCYYPAFRYHVPPTNPDRVLRLVDVARERLQFVYPGNIGRSSVDTACPSCGELLIRRNSYQIEIGRLDEHGCLNCRAAISVPGVAADES
jgi:pyruvate formate lyase activating enzyme